MYCIRSESIVKSNEKVLYADNQIGYTEHNIAFKKAVTGIETNPYDSMKDGLYQTTIDTYHQFCLYIGEHVGSGAALYSRCKAGQASMYVLKRKGYYGFFILKTTGSSKGISIVNGGTTKKITDSTDMKLICDNFDNVLSDYLHALLPLRKAQEQLSQELKELGLDGRIHGCIIDIDNYHHIMINPWDGTITFYYSSHYGQIMPLYSFDEVIQSLQIHSPFISSPKHSMLLHNYEAQKKCKGFLLSSISNNILLESNDFEPLPLNDRKEILVDKFEGMYGLSRTINPLQRLFSGHVLRSFDLLTNFNSNSPIDSDTCF